MPARRVRVLAALALLAAGTTPLAGCGGGVAVTDGGPAVLVTDAGFLTGDEALIRGTLAVTDAGCIGITDTQGDTYPTIWPRGTRLVDGVETAIDIPGVGVTRLGDDVDGAGGYYGTSNRPVLDDVAERCEWEGEVIGIRFD